MLVFDLLWAAQTLESYDARNENGVVAKSMLILIHAQDERCVKVKNTTVVQSVAQ